MSDAASPVRLERDGDLAVVVFDSPPLNLFDEELILALERTVNELVEVTRPGDDGRARAVVFRAEGKVVSGGVDVSIFQGIAEGPEPAEAGGRLWRRLLEMIHTVESLSVPTIFAAHSLTLTAAFELALACDLILAAEKASFGLVEIVVGLTPSMGGPQRLAERAGANRARELVYTGERYDAATLERWNVVNRVLPDEGFTEAALAFGHRLAAGPTLAHHATKRIVSAAARGGVWKADDVVPATSGELFASDDLRGAVTSFLTDGPGKAAYRGR